MAPVQLLTQDQVAEWLQVSPATLKTWRTRGGGPPAVKIGSVVRYDQAEVAAWLRARAEARTQAPPRRRSPRPARPAPAPAAPVEPGRLRVVGS